MQRNRSRDEDYSPDGYTCVHTPFTLHGVDVRVIYISIPTALRLSRGGGRSGSATGRGRQGPAEIPPPARAGRLGDRGGSAGSAVLLFFSGL